MHEVQYMSVEEVAVSLETARLELRYQEALRQAENIYEQERYRSQRVLYLLLQDENDTLRDNMLEDQDEMQKLELANEDMHHELAASDAAARDSQTTLAILERELKQYKAERSAFQIASSDTEKVVSEKLALSRELAALRPELEHLKSLAATQQNFLAEKLALERECSALQVELETEKRAVLRIKAQDKVAGHGESVMLSEIEGLKKEIATEKRNTQRQDREHMKKASEWDSQKEIMEGKLQAFRNKLRTTKEQLKEVQDQLEKAQAAKFAQSVEATKARIIGGNVRKRNVAHFDPDMTIGTPGHGGPAKKQKLSISAGDKSTFSITPFLNRTMSIPPGNLSEPDSEDAIPPPQARMNEVIETSENEDLQSKIKSPLTKPLTKKSTTVRKPSEPLKETTKVKANKAVRKPALAKVNEEEILEKEVEAENTWPVETISTVSAPEAIREPKKTKLFPNRPTLFDDDDGDLGSKRTKKLNLTSLRGGASTLSLNKVNLGGKNKVLAEFSPLKKDRRLIV